MAQTEQTLEEFFATPDTCSYCGWESAPYVDVDHYVGTPDVNDDAAWSAEAKHHAENCLRIVSRGFASPAYLAVVQAQQLAAAVEAIRSQR